MLNSNNVISNVNKKEEVRKSVVLLLKLIDSSFITEDIFTFF